MPARLTSQIRHIALYLFMTQKLPTLQPWQVSGAKVICFLNTHSSQDG